MNLLICIINIFSWKEWISFPVKYSELPVDTVLCVTIYDIFTPRKPIIVASSSYSVFDLRSKYVILMKFMELITESKDLCDRAITNAYFHHG